MTREDEERHEYEIQKKDELIDDLKKENKLLKECVDFYSDFINQDNTDEGGGCFDISYRARKTLEQINKRNK